MSAARPARGNDCKEAWPATRERLAAWWRRDGLVLHVEAPREASGAPRLTAEQWFELPAGLDPESVFADPVDPEAAWLDAGRRVRIAESWFAATFFGGEAFPCFEAHLGPGSLALLLGSEPEFAADTVWFRPCLRDPERHPPLRLDRESRWFRRQAALLEAGRTAARGRYRVAMPDLVENLDTLAALRGTEALLIDLLERPAFVRARIAEINAAYIAAFDRFLEIVEDAWGGNAYPAFKIWGPGRTAVVQCDAAAMISPAMFHEFVVPALTEQCAWLDHSLYHLDGTQALVHLDAVLAIDALDAIEWTPQAGRPRGGDPAWHPLYRRILEAGKSVQVIDVEPGEVAALLDAIGTRGVFVRVRARDEPEARALVEAVEAYR